MSNRFRLKHSAFPAAIALAFAVCLPGCVFLKRVPNYPGGSGALPPRVSDITDKIQCEIIEAIHHAKYDANSPLQALAVYTHVMSINLTLEVTNTQAINPALSYIHPDGDPMTSFSTPVNGQWTATEDRNFNESFTVVFDRGDETADKWNYCEQLQKSGGKGLQGSLGLEEVIASGLRYESDKSGAYTLRVLGLSPSNDVQDPLTNAAALAPSVGSTIDFAVTYGANGGPSWTLTRFTGPSSTSTGLVAFTRETKDTLIVSLARVVPSTTTSESERESAAGNAAKQNLTNQILQRLLIVR